MMNNKTNQKGFANIVVIVIMVLIVGAVSFFAWARSRNSNIIGGTMQITSPVASDVWEQGKTYQVRWNGGKEKVSLSLIDKSLQSVGASVSKRWSITDINNNGFYSFTVPNDLEGVFEFYLSDVYNHTDSEYFTIKKTSNNIFNTPGIVIQSPKPNEVVQFPITIYGYINGSGWAAFEGVAGSVQLFDSNNKPVSERIPLEATTDWMNPLVHFKTQMKGNQALGNFTDSSMTLIFKSESEKDGEMTNSFSLPVKLKVSSN